MAHGLFLQEDIEKLWETAEIKPMVNQVLCHISNSPLELIDYCQKKGMAMEAYSPVAHGEALKNKAIGDMAEKYGVTIPQLCIRFDIQLGMIVLPKTANPEHMKVNGDVDFIFFARRLPPLRWGMNGGSPNLRKQLMANKWHICYN